MYHICNTGGRRIILFTHDDFEIRSLQETQSLIAHDDIDNSLRLYQFKNFDDANLGIGLVSHVDFMSRLQNERFVHLNYRYLQEFHAHDMVTSLLKVSYSNGFYPSCALGK